MNKTDVLSVLITFAFGVFAGGYLYLTDAASTVSNVTVADVEEVSEFTIVGDVYGGCREACPSFQIVNDGSYRYLYTPAMGAEQVLRQGTLPSKLFSQLRKESSTRALVQQSQPRVPAVCNSFSDGIDVKYEITIDGDKYNLDSCSTTVDGTSQLWKTLGSVWDYYETLGNKS